MTSQKRKKESYKEGETWELKYIRQRILRGKRKKKGGHFTMRLRERSEWPTSHNNKGGDTELHIQRT